MKKRHVAFMVFAVALMMAPTVFAAPYGAAGCGLGSVLFKGQNRTVDQVLAATTNGTFGNQTFGLSTGTSNCPKPNTITITSERLNSFVQANMDNLARDMAEGRGETLDTYADLLRVPAQDRPAFRRKLQANFKNIFTSSKVTMAEVVDNTSKVLSL